MNDQKRDELAEADAIAAQLHRLPIHVRPEVAAGISSAIRADTDARIDVQIAMLRKELSRPSDPEAPDLDVIRARMHSAMASPTASAIRAACRDVSREEIAEDNERRAVAFAPPTHVIPNAPPVATCARCGLHVWTQAEASRCPWCASTEWRPYASPPVSPPKQERCRAGYRFNGDVIRCDANVGHDKVSSRHACDDFVWFASSKHFIPDVLAEAQGAEKREQEALAEALIKAHPPCVTCGKAVLVGVATEGGFRHDECVAKVSSCTRRTIQAADPGRRFRGCPERGDRPAAPIPMYLTCPKCSTRHVDEGEFATKSHHTHSCQNCGLTWRPAIVPTVGVAFLPGFKDELTPPPPVEEPAKCECDDPPRWGHRPICELYRVPIAKPAPEQSMRDALQEAELNEERLKTTALRLRAVVLAAREFAPHNEERGYRQHELMKVLRDLDEHDVHHGVFVHIDEARRRGIPVYTSRTETPHANPITEPARCNGSYDDGIMCTHCTPRDGCGRAGCPSPPLPPIAKPAPEQTATDFPDRIVVWRNSWAEEPYVPVLAHKQFVRADIVSALESELAKAREACKTMRELAAKEDADWHAEMVTRNTDLSTARADLARVEGEMEKAKRSRADDYDMVKAFDVYGTGGDLSGCLREMLTRISELTTACGAKA